jgi:hypothetical protein
MMKKTNDHRTKSRLLDEIEQLRAKLDEAEQTLQAIRSGDVDALVVEGPRGESIFSLTGAEHIYRVIAETMHEAALTVNVDGTILFCNRRFCDLMKISLNEVLGRKVTGFVSNPQKQPLEKLLADVQAGPVIRRLTFRASDGTAVPVQLSASLIEEDSITSICLLASDLTELEASAKSIRVLREHQQALEESEHRFRAIFESSQDAIVIVNDEALCVQANPAAGAIFDLPPEQMLGKHISEFVCNGFENPLSWQSYLDSGTFYGTRSFIGADGHVRHIGCNAVANILQNRHLFVIRNITKRKQAEEELQAALDRISSILERMSDGFVTFDRDWRYTQINPAAAQIFKMAPEQLLGKKIWEMWPGSYEHPVGVHFRRSLEENKPLRFEAFYPEPPNAWFECRCHPMPEGLATFFTDITERKRAEEELRQSERRYRSLHAELELRVRERTAELERKNRELQDFAFIASHDLNEPLRKIQTFGDLLKAKSADHLSEQERDYVSRMAETAKRMQELLDALLRYSRIESKGQNFRPIRLNDVVQDAAGDLELPMRKIEARLEIGALPIINGDPNQLRQLFQNIFFNALKYHRSEVKTFIKVHSEENKGTARIFVEDNGIGFDEKYLDKIFQPFQRLHGKHEYSGTGMGLAICRKIVERHHGMITAKSILGKGSTFIITLPVGQAGPDPNNG